MRSDAGVYVPVTAKSRASFQRMIVVEKPPLKVMPVSLAVRSWRKKRMNKTISALIAINELRSQKSPKLLIQYASPLADRDTPAKNTNTTTVITMKNARYRQSTCKRMTIGVATALALTGSGCGLVSAAID